MLGPSKIQAVLGNYGSLSREKSRGTHERFVRDPSWAHLKARPDEGALSVNDPEWAFRRAHYQCEPLSFRYRC